ncbi:trinucleotide repeat-containing gene 6B protein isoform X2 [Lampris incognitus]|uniref:trinucleotide repeat-containing gene 6B protein isoform X2 n=1 Tax=Lampris incognitus TaxID=2546036 RepID=UPI0024B5BBD0|nr:trinucleotide repeat-containing gene 6B protein isoform X2 [Lampris incognitus]
MEDKKRKKDDKRKRDTSQKVAEPKNKVSDATKLVSAQSPATQSSSASPSPGSTPSASPSPAAPGPGSSAAQPPGANNAKRPAVANGQTPSSAGSSGGTGNGGSGGAVAPQQQQRYMPREVPPRFRCQQDHKVLLKRGQPPLSSMLLGGGGGGGGDGPNANMAAASDSSAVSSSLALTSSAAASTTTSNYANSMWGAGSGGQASTQGREKVIVDGNDLEEWPSIAGSDGGGGASVTVVGVGGSGSSNGMPVKSSISASGNQSTPTSSFSLPSECMQSSGGVAWGTTASHGHPRGGNAAASAGNLLQQPPSLSKASSVPGSHDADGPVDGSSGIPGANFNPNANPSAWPALVQQDGSSAAGDGGPSSLHHQGSGGSLSANNPTSHGPGLGGGTVGVLGGHPTLSVNQSNAHQHQLHQMQSRDREVGGGKWESGSAGPKMSGEEGVLDCGLGGGVGGGGGGDPASSWRGQPSYPAANSKTGASRTDGWGGGGFGAAEGDTGTSGWGYPGPPTGGNAWGSAGSSGGGGQTSRLSQGGWGSSGVSGERGQSGEDWSGSSAGVGGANAGGERISGACSSNSSSSGGSIASNPPVISSSSPPAPTTSRAWDNQKGEGDVGDWGGGGAGGHGGRGGSLTSSGNSRSGSGQSGHSHRVQRTAPNAEAALQNLLNRADLDPRVLSNTGWGQTQIRQNTAWDLDGEAAAVAGGVGGSRGGSSSSSSSSSASSKHPQSSLGSSSSQYSGGSSALGSDPMGSGTNPSLGPSAGSSGDGWESSSNSSSSGASQCGRGPPPSGPNMRNSGVSQSGPMTSGASTGAGGLAPGHSQQGKAVGWGGGGMGTGESQGAKGWGNEEWRGSRGGNAGGWGEVGQQGNPAGGRWGESQEEKGTSGWREMGREGGGAAAEGGGGWGLGQRAGGGGDWSEREPKSNNGGAGGGEDGVGWGEERKGGGGNSGGESNLGTWGSWDNGTPRRAWGAGGGSGGGGGMGDSGSKPHQSWNGGNGGGSKVHQMPNGQSGSVKAPQAPLQQSQPRNQHPPQQQALDQGAMQGGWGRQPVSQAQNQNQSSGWTSGPIPSGPGGGGGGSEPSGWEEPSPQSISRKNEIDDGTSAWGDPTHYNYKPVNLWDKNSTPSGQQLPVHGQAPAQQQPLGPPLQQQPSRQTSGLSTRDVNPGHVSGKASAVGPSGWGSTSPTSLTVDNGTAAWGKPSDTPTGWGEPDDSAGKASGWGNPSPNPVKSGSKSMQDGWGESESSVAATRNSSWEEEEEAGGMWNSAGSQGSGSSWGQGSNGGWGQGHAGKKASSKGPLKAGSGDSWMNPINRQFSNMGLLGDDPSGRSIDLAPGSLQDKKMDGDKRGMGMSDYNGDIRKGGRGPGVAYRSQSSKEVGPGDAGSYYDKGGHNMLGSGGGMAQSRHQPSAPPINPSPGIRAQVPHQFLSPQVPGSMLKQMAPPSGNIGGVGGVGGVTGVGGGVFPPQLSPQHIAMLSSIYPPHIQFQLACQLLLQQQPQQQQLLQNQRKFTQNVRQQADPQQLARIMAVLQQQRQQQAGGLGGLGGSSKLSPSHFAGGAGGVPKLPGADSLPHPGLGGPMADLHQKTHSGYSGFTSGINLSGLDLGGSVMGGPGGMKDLGVQQSRFKWMMDGHSPPDPSPPESTLHKNGPITPMKMPGGSPYSQYDMLGEEGLGDTWHRNPGNKMASKASTTPSWPPEFQPGVPWKGISRVDPESDPYMTPGSMMGNSGSPSLNDTEHQLLQDNTDSTPPLNTLLPSPGAWPYSASDSPLSNAHNTAKYTEYKPSWPPEPIGHNKPWRASRGSSQTQLPRPPPGLASQKQPSPSPWSGGIPRLAARGWGGGSSTTGSTWSDGSSRGSCWLVLSNLTPQIDGSTLRTICMQHGPLLTFHLGLTQGTALIRYSSKQEAAKAQSALHMCVLGNTTILAEFVSEEDVARYIAHSQAGGGGTSAGSAGSTASANGNGGSGERGAGVSAVDGGSTVSGSGNGAPGPSSSGWQSLDITGSAPDPTVSQGPGLGIFAQWSSNGAGVGGVTGVGGGVGGMDAGRQGLWGGMGGAGYPSSSLWGAPALDDAHQMGSPAALLPGDLLGGGADSI